MAVRTSSWKRAVRLPVFTIGSISAPGGLCDATARLANPIRFDAPTSALLVRRVHMGDVVDTLRPGASVAAWRRSDLAGALRQGDVGRTVVVCGWVHGRRDHGGIVFLDVRDRAGIVQVVCDPSTSSAAHAAASDLRLEYVVGVRGTVRPRPAETVNPDLPTGTIEIVAAEVGILHATRHTPFPVDDSTAVGETNHPP